MPDKTPQRATWKRRRELYRESLRKRPPLDIKTVKRLRFERDTR
jgi:hypothetical protein